MRENGSTRIARIPRRRRLRSAAARARDNRQLADGRSRPAPARCRRACDRPARRRRARGDRARRLGRARGRPAVALARLPVGAARDRLRLAAHRLAAALPDGVARTTRWSGALPLYAKTHSYGEYVFDWAWADAYRRHGRRYYPKLVAAIPFTPVPGPRLLARDAATRARAARARAAAMLARRTRISSLHVLFPTDGRSARCASAAGMILRHGVQFHWDEPRLPRLRRLPRGVQPRQAQEGEAGAAQARAKPASRSRASCGSEITAADWAFFHRCYEGTYRAHHSTPYLSLDFFERIGATMPRAPAARPRHARRPADLRRARRLRRATRCGAATGARPSTCPGCISRPATTRRSSSASSAASRRFEGGAQGVHKLARGLLPVTTYSAHAIADPAFARGDRRFLRARARRCRAHRRRAGDREPVPDG